jgi:hypothetical protein
MGTGCSSLSRKRYPRERILRETPLSVGWHASRCLTLGLRVPYNRDILFHTRPKASTARGSLYPSTHDACMVRMSSLLMSCVQQSKSTLKVYNMLYLLPF